MAVFPGDTELETPAVGDKLPIYDIDEATEDVSKYKYVLYGTFFASPTFTGRVTLSDDAATPPLSMTARSSAPSTPSTGDIYLDDGTNSTSTNVCLRYYNGSSWEDIG